MKITILLRYPLLESSEWKIELIDKLIKEKYYINLIFGEASILKQTRAVLKEFGIDIFKRERKMAKSIGRNLYSYFNSKIPVSKVSDLNSSLTAKIIRRFNPDFILLLGTGIIRKNILLLPVRGTIHCHHGYLPKYRGVNTAEWNLFHEGEVYINTHFVDNGIDTGDILLRKRISVFKSDTIDSIRLRCRTESVDLILETFKKLETGEIIPIPQKKNEGKQYYTMHPFFKDLLKERIKIRGI